METNRRLERLEIRLYDLLDRMLDQERWEEAGQLIRLMQAASII